MDRIGVSVAVALMLLVGVTGAPDVQAQTIRADEAADIIGVDPGCPSVGDQCDITRRIQVLPGGATDHVVPRGCGAPPGVAPGTLFDFGNRDVTVTSTSFVAIGEGALTIKARNFTVAKGGEVNGEGVNAGSLTVLSTGHIAIESDGGEGRVRLSGLATGGTVYLEADGNILLDGLLRVDNLDVAADGGDLSVCADGDILTGSRSTVSVKGGNQGFGGTLEFRAGGRIETAKDIDASGGDGGDIDMIADGGAAIIRDKVTVNGGGDAGGGGDIRLETAGDLEIVGAIQAKGSGSGGGEGGTITVEDVGGDVFVRNEVNARGGSPDGGGGSIDISTHVTTGGSVTITGSGGELIADGNGTESDGGEILVDARLDVTVSGDADASGGDGFGEIALAAGRHIVIAAGSLLDARGRATTSFAGDVILLAGETGSGNATVHGKIDVTGGGCDTAADCGLGGGVEIQGCDVTLGLGAVIDASAAGPTGGGGVTSISARRQALIDGVVDATGNGTAGVNEVLHAAGRPPQIRPGAVTPAAVITACDGTCAGSCASFCDHFCDCGDGTVDEFEECEPASGCAAGNEEVCVPAGGSGECTCIVTCGNGVIDPSEECDGGNLGGLSCEALGFPGGQLSCTASCTLDDSSCDPIVCPDGMIGDGEVCEPGNLDDRICETLGFVGGTLACRADCTAYDTSGCDQGTCGDGLQCFGTECTTGPAGGPESCDDGGANSDNAACLSDCSRAMCGDGKVCSVVCVDDTDDDVDDCAGIPSCDTGPTGSTEDCDDGNDSDNDACLNNCQAAMCGDSVLCSDAGCTSGPAGGPEECDESSRCCESDCSIRACNETGPCTSEFICCPPGANCDDGDPCTTDGCVSANGCVHTPIAGCPACATDADCDDGNACTTDSCDPATALCSSSAAADGTVCEDGNVCTAGDMCNAGACVAGTPLDETAVASVVGEGTQTPPSCAAKKDRKRAKKIARQMKAARKKLEKAVKVKDNEKKRAKRLKQANAKLAKARKLADKAASKVSAACHAEIDEQVTQAQARAACL